MNHPCNLGLAGQRTAMGRRELTAEALMRATLDRIAERNPGLTAIVSLRPEGELMDEARAADHTRPAGALHGIPVAVKDLVETEGIRTTHGSPIFADHVPETDDTLAANLRAAGAILIGKTNVPEFGLGSHSTNPVFGVTRNPYDPARTAGGSSGGAAAALAARLVPVADGSDMMGSLRNPAAFCNVYGLRPSVGLVPRQPGGDTFLPQLSTAGPMARDVADLAALLDVMAQPDGRVPHNLAPQLSFLGRLEEEIAGRRIGWIGDWQGYLPFEPGILDLCREALEVFVRLGAAVVEVTPRFDPAALWHAWTTLRHWEVSIAQGPHYRDPARRALLKSEAVWEIENGLPLTAGKISAASALRSDWFATLTDLFGTFDALALPSAQVWPFPAGWRWPRSVAGWEMDTYHRWMEVVVPASLAGVPALNVPVGFGAEGLPMGLQLLGPKGGDAELLQLGHAYHVATDWPGRRPPAFTES